MVADQQYVWRPTIRELESFEDMVGLEEPLEVTTSHFDPEEIEIEGRAAWELIRPDDVFTEPEPITDYPPIHTLYDFEVSSPREVHMKRFILHTKCDGNHRPKILKIT